MTGRVPVRRTTGHARRGRSIRRASAGLSPLRAGAILVMLLTAGAMYGVSASPIFAFRRLAIDDRRFTTEEEVRDTLDLADGINLISLRTDDLAARLTQLITVHGAHLSVELPDTIRVALDERQPIVVWQAGDRRFLVDRDGVLFASEADGPPDVLAGLRVVDDQRASSASLAVGQTLDPVDLDAATRLGSLTPADVGSAATGLAVLVDDERGFVVQTVPEGWTATFGFYTPTIRTTDLIPGQVRLLRSLLGKVGESKVATLILADDKNGTYTERKP